MPDQIKPEITDTAVAPCSALNCLTQKHVVISCTNLATSVSDYVLTSLAPNTFVLGIDRDRDVMVVHRLVAEEKES